tara:strand:+ start:2966 stop:4456 length:1491 start_codon:yes stop_codon:yes gene_type:complete
MSTEAKATGYLELDLTGFDQAIKTAKKMLGGLAAGFAAFKTAEFFKDGIKDAITFGKEMQVASNKMGGFDVGKMLIVQKALEKAGLGAEEARGAMADFVDSGRDISTIFGGADNYAKALKSAAADYGSQANVLTRSAKALQTVWNTLESIGSKMKTFFLTMTEQFVGPLQAALDYLNEIDLAGIGKAFGESIAKAATLLIGLFKNGDIWNAAKIGMTIAFQEAINYLVGGFNWVRDNIIPKIGEYLGDAFNGAMKMMGKTLEFIFSSEGIIALLQGFAGIGAIIATSLLKAVNVFSKAIAAGTSLAILHAIDAIPGASTLLGLGGGPVASFGELFDDAEGPVSESFIEDVGKGGEENRGAFGEKLTAFMEKNGMTGGEGDGKFKKANVFDTEGKRNELSDIVTSAFKTGEEMIGKSGKNNKPPAILNQLSGGGAHVIADSLAKVGGGGNSLKVGMSLAERSALRTAKATEQTAKATEAMAENGKGGGGTTKPPLGR